MKLVQVQPEDFEKYLVLNKEFVAYNKSLGIDEMYGLKGHSDTAVTQFIKEKFEKRLKKEKSFFYFVEHDSELAGYIFGYIEETGGKFEVVENGYISSLFVTQNMRGKGVSTFMKNEFLTWLKKNNIHLCQIHVAALNSATIDIYKKWGFAIDELRLYKEI